MKFLRQMAILLAVALLLPVSARAAGGSITVEHKLEDGTPLTGVTFRLYRVEESITTAPNAYAYMLKHELEPVASLQTDEQGRVVFSDLEDGTYLLVGSAHRVGEQVCQIDMSLLKLPLADGSANVVVDTKYELKDEVPVTEYRVIVIWLDAKTRAAHPDSVEIHRYRNGEIFDTITVGTTENWQYRWEETDPAAEWAVVEEVPAGYTVSYEREGNTFLIYNQPEEEEPTDPTETDPTETKPTEPDGPKLPQTGQLWWPVPVLAILGMVLVMLGWLRRKESLDEA